MTRGIRSTHRERGAVLIVGLILLLVMTVLAVATMGTASLELAMAGNTQSAQNAFQLAETGIDVSLAAADDDRDTLVATAGAPPVCTGATDVPEVGSYEACTRFADEVTPLPGSSAGIGVGLAAYHFVVTSEGRSFRDARAVHHQSFYVPGPGGGR
jgi:type IV pilus assembly protein PilX